MQIRRQEVMRPILVTFSGIDGAGKTTQIERLIEWMRSSGLDVRLVRFWDDVAALRQIRESAGHALFKGEKGIGAPGKPVRRRDKNVRSWYMNPMRLALCFLDAWRTRHKVNQLTAQTDVDAIIFDRYAYDQFANLQLENGPTRRYIRLLLRLVPKPDVAFLLDSDPAQARERKPEYPIDFLRLNRASYQRLACLAGMVLIEPDTPDSVAQKVRSALTNKIRIGQHADLAAVSPVRKA